MKTSIFPAFAVAALLAPVAAAQDMKGAAQSVVDCRGLEDPEARLACFDAASEPLAEMLSAPKIPGWADAPSTPEKTDSASGEDKLPIWARIMPRSDSADTPDEITITVTRIMRNNVGRHFFFTEDGQEWEQVVAEQVKPPKSLPAGATISESTFGSPKLRFTDGPSGAYGVRRVD